MAPARRQTEAGHILDPPRTADLPVSNFLAPYNSGIPRRVRSALALMVQCKLALVQALLVARPSVAQPAEAKSSAPAPVAAPELEPSAHLAPRHFAQVPLAPADASLQADPGPRSLRFAKAARESNPDLLKLPARVAKLPRAPAPWPERYRAIPARGSARPKLPFAGELLAGLAPGPHASAMPVQSQPGLTSRKVRAPAPRLFLGFHEPAHSPGSDAPPSKSGHCSQIPHGAPRPLRRCELQVESTPSESSSRLIARHAPLPHRG